MAKFEKLVWKRKEKSNGKKSPPEKWGLGGYWVTDDDIEEAKKIEKWEKISTRKMGIRRILGYRR